MAAHEQQNSTPTPGEAVYTAYLEKSKRTSASILGWDPQSLREDLRKLGWTGGDVEDAVTYWSSLPRVATVGGWRRNLTMECIEPNPGPAMCVFFDDIAARFGASRDVVRSDLHKIELLVEAQPAGKYGHTEKEVAAYFTNLSLEQFAEIVESAVEDAKSVYNEIRKQLGLAGQSLLDGLPELGPRKASQSKPSISKQHEGVDHTVKLFRLTNKTLLRTPSIIWQLALRGNFFWAAEATLVTYVSLVLSDCFQMLGLQDLSVLQEVTLHSLRPDLIIVFNGIHPIGVVEIKTPHPGVLDDRNVHGQIYDYMKRIQQYFGVQHIFGIVTTYTQWRVFWLPTTDDTASSEDSAVNSSATSMHSEEEDPHETFEDKDIDVDLEPVQSSLRHVSCTAIYEWNDPQLPRVLCTAIWKMRCSPVAPVTLGDPMRELCCMTATHTVWVKSPFAKPNFKLNYRNAPTASAEKFILLKDLGFGAEGRVWMVCSTTGQVGALKFRHAAINGETLEESLQKLKDEADNWDLLYKKGRIVQAGGFDGLLMPYARPSSIASTSYSTSDAQAAVKEAVVHIAKNGYIHNDMNIRHTGVISPAKKGGKPTGLVTDLSSLVKHDGDEEKALTTMLAALGMK